MKIADELKAFIFGASIVFIGVIVIKSCGKAENNSIFQQVLQDSLVKIRNTNGSLTAKVNLLVDKDIKNILSIKSQDQIIKTLQDEIKKNKKIISKGGSVTVFSTTTTYTSQLHNDSIVNSNGNDSISNCTCTYYSSSIDSTWVVYKITSKRDSTKLSLRIKNEYSVVIGSEKINLFKRKPVAFVTTKNPYDDIKSMKAFEVEDTRKRLVNISIQAGYGITLKGMSPYVGIGMGVDLWEMLKK